MINSFQEIEESFTDERTTYWSIYSLVLPFLPVLLVILLPTQPTRKTCVLCIYTSAFQSNARKLSLIFNSLFFFILRSNRSESHVNCIVQILYITNLSTFLHIYYFHPISSIIIYLLNYCNSLQTDFTTSTLRHQQFALHREAISYDTH